MGLYKLLRKVGLPIWVAAVCGGTILVLYGVMTGFGVSVCRAIGMYLLRMVAQLVGRTYDMLTALGFVGTVMALLQPAWLGHMGYLLSFGSVLGLGLLVPALSKSKDEEAKVKPQQFVEGRLRRGMVRVGRFLAGLLKEGMLSGLCITLTTLPIQLWFSYEVSIYSVFLNALILPLMSGVMVAGLVAMIVPGLGIVGTVDVMILSGYEGLCHVFESLPAAMWNPGRPAVWQLVVYYLLWALVVWIMPWLRKKIPRFHWGQFGLLAAAVGVLGLPRWHGDRVTFLDVGQGDCICVQLSSGETYLFDCGSSSKQRVGEEVLIPFLKYYGISELDGVFASHGDMDHVNGLQELVQLAGEYHITVRQIVLPDRNREILQEEFGEMLKLTGNRGIPVRVIQAGERWGNGEDAFLCLHPLSRNLTGGNESSQCFYIGLREGAMQVSFLLTGDVEGAGERALTESLKQYDMGQVSVLKVAHHGSKYSTEEAFLEVVQPRLAVISCGRNNYGHPHGETLQRLDNVGSTVVTTREWGAITVELEKEITVYGWRKEE